MTNIITACPKEAIPEIVNRLVDSEASLGEKLLLVETVECAALKMSDTSATNLQNQNDGGRN